MSHSGSVVGERGSLKVIHCSECGFAHLDPIPTEDLYTDKFYASIKPNYLKEQLKYSVWWEDQYALDYSILKNEGVGSGEFLDIGSGYGLFAEYGKSLGIAVQELEPGNQPRLLRKGVIASTIENAELGMYNAIRLAWVLEHVMNPLSVLKKCKEHLLPGGRILITVPNDISPLQQIVSKLGIHEPYYWIHPTHTNYFNKVGLLELLGKAGLKVNFGLSSFPMEYFLLMGLDYSANEEVGEIAHQQRVTFETNLIRHSPGYLLELKIDWYDKGIGRDLTIVAESAHQGLPRERLNLALRS